MMDKVKEALLRFKAIVDTQECLCEETHRCTMHYDRMLADRALEAIELLGENVEGF